MKFTDHALLEQVNPATNTDKFYELWLIEPAPAEGLDSYVALFHWGRRGTAGQWQANAFASLAGASGAWQKKRTSKLSGGYTSLDGVPSEGTLGENVRSHVFEDQKITPLAPTAASIDPVTVSVALSDFLSTLLEAGSVTAEHVTTRTTLMEQMDELRDLMQQTEGAFELADTVYRSRLA
jgi:predicted DNA-binding WGR domain protein